jgi:hypothetical protein
MVFLKSIVLCLSLIFILSPVVYAHEPGPAEPAHEKPMPEEFIREESAQEETELPLIQAAQARCIETGDSSPRGAMIAGPMVAGGEECLMDAFTDLMVEQTHEFILFQAQEILRHCTSEERSERMDNFGECMQPFDILIERVSAPCRKAFGAATKTAFDCVNAFNEKMLSKAGWTTAEEGPSEVQLMGLWYTLGAGLLAVWGMVIVFKRL